MKKKKKISDVKMVAKGHGNKDGQKKKRKEERRGGTGAPQGPARPPRPGGAQNKVKS